MYTTLPEMAMRPADAYECLVRGRVESVEIDHLMGRILAVMVVPYPPGIPVIMPGERLTPATKSIHDYLLDAREFDQQVPGLRDRYPWAALRAHGRRQALPGGLRHEGERTMIPRDVKAPTIPIPFHKLLKVVAIVDDEDPQTKELLDHITAENFEVEVEPTASIATSPRMPRSAPISR